MSGKKEISLYCPGCRYGYLDTQELVTDPPTYDCYCEICKWSGDISPDEGGK